MIWLLFLTNGFFLFYNHCKKYTRSLFWFDLVCYPYYLIKALSVIIVIVVELSCLMKKMLNSPMIAALKYLFFEPLSDRLVQMLYVITFVAYCIVE